MRYAVKAAKHGYTLKTYEVEAASEEEAETKFNEAMDAGTHDDDFPVTDEGDFIETEMFVAFIERVGEGEGAAPYAILFPSTPDGREDGRMSAMGKISQRDFIERWKVAATHGIARYERGIVAALPCNCLEDSCDGWQMVGSESIDDAMRIYSMRNVGGVR